MHTRGEIGLVLCVSIEYEAGTPHIHCLHCHAVSGPYYLSMFGQPGVILGVSLHLCQKLQPFLFLSAVSGVLTSGSHGEGLSVQD